MPSTDMEKKLEEDNPVLFAKFVTLQAFVDQILSGQIPNALQAVATPTEFFTDHGPQHLNRVLSKLDALSSFVPDKLNQREQFVLLVATYCHDLGMFLGRLPNESPNETRIHHHERSADLLDRLVRDGYVNLDTFETSVTKHIVTAHRSVNLDEVPETHDFPQFSVRTRLLSAMLRIADACDLDHTRAPEAVFRFLIDSIPPSSQQHWRQHHIVAAVNFDHRLAAIVVSVQLDGNFVEKVDKMRMTNSLSKELERELASVSDVFARYGVGLVRVEIKDYETDDYLDLSSCQLYDNYYLLAVSSGIQSIGPLHEAIKLFLGNDQGPAVVIEITPPEGPLIIDTGFRVNPLNFGDFEKACDPHIEYSKKVVTKMEIITQ